MSDVSWVRLLPEVGEPILHRLRLIEARELAVAAELVLLRSERRALVRDVRLSWSDSEIAAARAAPVEQARSERVKPAWRT